MKKNKGIKKLQLEKITISKLTHLHLVRGGSNEQAADSGLNTQNVNGSNCQCTVTMALSEECDPDDYDLNLL